jgi:ABC-type transport system involved in multi-copper enzyme maturation permease subunit
MLAASAFVAVEEADGSQFSVPGLESVSGVDALLQFFWLTRIGTQLFVAAIAVIAITHEFSSGTIQTTVISVPRRLPVIAAKVVVVATVTAVLSLLSSLVQYAATRSMLDPVGRDASIVDPTLVAAMLADALYLVAVALFALMIATIVRNAALAITIVLVVVFGILLVGGSLPMIADVPAEYYFLSYAADMTTSLLYDPTHAADFVRNLVVTLAWIVVPSLVASVAFARRSV